MVHGIRGAPGEKFPTDLQSVNGVSRLFFEQDFVQPEYLRTFAARKWGSRLFEGRNKKEKIKLAAAKKVSTFAVPKQGGTNRERFPVWKIEKVAVVKDGQL